MVELADVAGAEYSFARHEHAELRAGLAELHDIADVAGRVPATEAAAAIRRIRHWLAAVLVPHAAWEDSVIYPEIEEATGTKWATKLMRFEHFQIERSVQVLDQDILTLAEPVITHDQVCEIRSHILGLEAVLRAHIEREDLFLLPILQMS
jgi:iron-sulfur cluster repair protein YtfE (RIC family)